MESNNIVNNTNKLSLDLAYESYMCPRYLTLNYFILTIELNQSILIHTFHFIVRNRAVWQLEYTFRIYYSFNTNGINYARIQSINSKLLSDTDTWTKYQNARSVQRINQHVRFAAYCAMKHIYHYHYLQCVNSLNN